LILLAIVSLSSTVLAEAKVPVISLGFGRLYITDVFLFGLFGLIILRSLVEPKFKLIHTPLDWPLLIFYGVALVATVSQLLTSSLAISLAIPEMRTVTYYLTFFAVTNLIREKRQLDLLLQGLLLLATGVAAAMILQFMLGNAVQLLPGRVESLATEGRQYSDITRIIPPGESLILTGFITATVMLVLDKPKLISILKFLQWALLGVAVVLTFNRNFWVGVGLALLLLVYLARGADRQRLLRWSLVAVFAAAVGLVVIAIQPGARTTHLVNATLERLVSLVNSQTYENSPSSTLRWRDFEYHYALPQIAAHPILGLGLGARYRPFVPNIDYEKFDGRGFTHNAHMWIILKTGILGYLCLIWLSLTFLHRGFKEWRYVPNRVLRGTVLGFTLTYLGVVLGSLVNPMLMEWFWTPVIGIMLGVNEVIFVQFAKRQNS
jgi:O-antigen ligase